jgi:hypothetical protein
MAATVTAALVLLDASSLGSLWSLTMAVTAMAVGGTVSSGEVMPEAAGEMGGLAGPFGGGTMGPSMSGAVDAVPLGVTLVGAVVLWTMFSRRLWLKRQRQFSPGELAVRAAGAATTALVVFLMVAGLGRGAIKMPASALEGVGGGLLTGGLGGGGDNPFADLLGGGTASEPTLTYQVSAGSVGFGAVLWVAVVLAVGGLISRRVRLPLGGSLDRLRLTWAPSLSAVVRTIVVLAAVPLVLLASVGLIVGGRSGTAAGAAILVFPNVLAIFLSLGVGSSWTVGVHPVQSEGGDPLAGLFGAIGGSDGAPQQPDRTEHLGSLSAGGWPLWLGALTVTGIILIGCAYRVSRVTDPTRILPLHPYRGPLARRIGMAERFGVVTAVVLGGAAWSASASGNFGISMFGSEMGGMRAELSGSVLWTVVFGLFVGGLAGFAGSLLSAGRGGRGPR